MPGSRATFAHDAVLIADPGADERAPGGAITASLCGDWAHDGPCPLAPHHTGVVRDGDRMLLRLLFAAAPEDEVRVRALVHEALTAGSATGPDGTVTTWRLVDERSAVIRDDERAHAGRLAAS